MATSRATAWTSQMVRKGLSITYFFAGTGTSIGDPTEVNSLGSYFSTYNKTKTDSSPLLIGSVKTNIGHTESAAGVAGLIKVLLMMKHGKIVPSLHVKKDKSNLNPKIDLNKYGLDIALDVSNWNANEDGDRLSCVNSFGFGGSNSHAIIIQKGQFTSAQRVCEGSFADNTVSVFLQQNNNDYIARQPTFPDDSSVNESKRNLHFVCLSAADKTGLQKTLDGFTAELKRSNYKIREIAYTSGCHRDHFPYRIGLVAKDNSELIDQCTKANSKIDSLKPVMRRRIVFVFCGVGTTWTGMCKELMNTEPVFRRAIKRIDKHLQPLTNWSIGDKFEANTDYSDPFLNHIAIFSVQIGLSELWKSWGVLPDEVIGQSVGEVAAAYVSGGLNLKDAVKVIYYRSKHLAEQRGGAMMVVGNYDIEKLEKLCDQNENKVVIAVYSSPTACTLSGDRETMQKIKESLEKEAEIENFNILLKELNVQCAYHSSHVENCLLAIKNDIGELSGREETIPHISTVTGENVPQTTFQSPDYWTDNVRKPVLFMQSIQAASHTDTTNVFLEVGPKQVLRAHISSFLDHKSNIALPSMGYQKECSLMLDSLSVLYQMGQNIDWNNFYIAKGTIVPIPKYAFNKTKMLYFSEPQQRYFKGLPSEEDGAIGQHMFLRSSASENADYKMKIDKKSTPYVYDHFLHNTILVPGATYVEAAFDIGHRSSSSSAYELSVSVEFVNPLTPSGDKQYQIEIETDIFRSDGPIQFTATKDKRVFAEGTIQQRNVSEKNSIDIEEIRLVCTRELTKAESYHCLEEFGFKYGESLSLINRSWTSGSECLVEIVLPDSVQSQLKSTHLHPAVIDAIFQTFGILSINAAEDSTVDDIDQGPTLPKGVGSFMLNCPPQKEMFVYAKETKKTKSGNHYNALLLAPNGNVIAEVNDFYTRTVTMSRNEKDQDLVYELTWNKLKLKRVNANQRAKGLTVIISRDTFIANIKACDPLLNCSFLEHQDDLSDTVSVLFKSLSEINKADIASIVFAPTVSLNNKNADGQALFQEAKQSFCTIKDLIISLTDAEISVPLTVVTECTQKVTCREGSCLNIRGSELWGLVRSAIREANYPGLKIVDMDLSAASINTFQKLLLDESLPFTEYVIENGNLFTSKLISYPKEKLDKSFKDITLDTSEVSYLMSANQQSLESPHFRLANLTNDTIINQEENTVRIQPTTICLHNRNIYPVTTGLSEGVHSLWPETNTDGFQMLALEGSGYISSQDENNKRSASLPYLQKVIFCSPFRVASTISVPKECAVKETLIPFYKPGMITTSVIVWSLIESEVDVASTLVVVCDSSTAYLARMVTDLIGTYKGCFGVVVAKENLSGEISDKSGQLQYARTAILLTTLNIEQTQLLLSNLKTIDRLATLQNFMPRELYRHFVSDVSVRILETESVFVSSSLRKTVPKVMKWLRSLKKDFWLNIAVASQGDVKVETRKSIYMFPYETFVVSDDADLDDKNNLERNHKPLIQSVPLRVDKPSLFRQNGMYILVGGLTGLGWELLNLMAEMGAGYLVTLSRRAPDADQQKAIEDVMFRFDCQVICLRTDITDFQKLKRSINDLKAKLGPIPIRGVLQGGGVLADCLLTKMSEEQIEMPMLPKILGTWNLHLLTKNIELDFFIMHSSIVSVFGNMGQCNYGAGNAFMDSLAHYRRGQGLCGQSINWGALRVGMAVKDANVEKSLNLLGMVLLNRYDIRTCFIYALMTNEPQICFGNFDWGKMAAFGPYPSNLTALIEHGMHVQKPGSVSSKKHVLDLNEFKLLSDEEKTQTMFELVVSVVCDVFVVEKDALDKDTTFISLGIDSMAGMTFVNVAFDRTQCRIPIVTLLSDQTTLGTITKYLIDNLNYDSDETANTDNTYSKKLIYGKIPFMQQNLLQEYVQDPDNPCWVRMADLEIQGIRIALRSWKAILNHVLSINPELRRLYSLDSEDGDFDSFVVPEKDAKVELERVSFHSLRQDVSETDIREGYMFDLRTQFPIRFQVATEGDCSILRVILHAVAYDIASLAMVFQDIAVITERYAKRKRIPETKPTVDINAVIQKILQPRLDELHSFWSQEFAADIQPATFYHAIEIPDGAYFIKMEQTVPQNIFDIALKYAHSNGITWFQYLVSLYQLLLYQKNPQSYVPVCTPIDMRIHAPELRRVITRCVNVCPLVADFTGDLTIGDFIKKNAEKIQNATQYSCYPYELIQEHMHTEDLKANINRHSLAMDNVTDINSHRKHEQVKVNVRNVWHTRTMYEFTAAFKHDQKTNKLVIEYGFNSKLCGLQYGALIPNRLMMLIERCALHADVKISDKVLTITDDDLGDRIPSVMANIPGADNIVAQKKTKDGRLSLADQIRRLSLSNGTSVEDTMVSESKHNKTSPTSNTPKSLIGYLRRLSKGTIEDVPVTETNGYYNGQIQGGFYKKIEDAAIVHNEFDRNELNNKVSNKDNFTSKLIKTENNELEPGVENGIQPSEVQQSVNNGTRKLSNELAKRRPSQVVIIDKENGLEVDTNQDAEKEQDIFILKAGKFKHAF